MHVHVHVRMCVIFFFQYFFCSRVVVSCLTLVQGPKLQSLAKAASVPNGQSICPIPPSILRDIMNLTMQSRSTLNFQSFCLHPLRIVEKPQAPVRLGSRSTGRKRGALLYQRSTLLTKPCTSQCLSAVETDMQDITVIRDMFQPAGPEMKGMGYYLEENFRTPY